MVQRYERSLDAAIEAPTTRIADSQSPSILKFFVLTFGLSLPFWLLGAVDHAPLLPGLPISALGFVCPAAAALILVYVEHGTEGVVVLLERSLDFKRIKTKEWYLPFVLLTPCESLVAYALMRMNGVPVPAPRFALLPTLGLFLAFFVAAIGEELGWSGYAIDRMQARWGALGASVLLGAVWAAIHWIPLIQVHRSLEWIAWWSLGTVATRVLIVWLYNAVGKSVFATVLFHAVSNLSWQLFPINGSYWDPRLNSLMTTVVATAVLAVAPRGLRMARQMTSGEQPTRVLR